jgi:hypothetical protein
MEDKIMEKVTNLGTKVGHEYTVECFDKDGKLKWEERFHNLVTTEGLNKYLDATLKTGLASPAWYVGLVKASTTGYAAGDTLASHSGWTEADPGTDFTGNRQAFTPGTITSGSVSNSGSKAVFPILGSLTIKGALLASAATGTSGTLLGVGNFTGGDRSVVSGDTLNVQVTASITSA